MKKYKKLAIIVTSVCVVGGTLFVLGGGLTKGSKIPKIMFPECMDDSTSKYEMVSEIKASRQKELEKEKSLRMYYVLGEKVSADMVDMISDQYVTTKQTENESILREVTVSDEECMDRAIGILHELEINMREYAYSGLIQGTGYHMDTPGEKITTSKEVVYVRKINDREVYGSQAKISIRFKGEGVESVLVDTVQIKEEKRANKVIKVKDALKEVKEHRGFIQTPEGTTKVVIEDVNIAYWEDYSRLNEINTIQPVYEFTGTAYMGDKKIGDFKAVESAVK